MSPRRLQIGRYTQFGRGREGWKAVGAINTNPNSTHGSQIKRSGSLRTAKNSVKNWKGNGFKSIFPMSGTLLCCNRPTKIIIESWSQGKDKRLNPNGLFVFKCCSNSLTEVAACLVVLLRGILWQDSCPTDPHHILLPSFLIHASIMITLIKTISKTIEFKLNDGDENANNHETSFSPTDPIAECKKEEGAQTEADILYCSNSLSRNIPANIS